MHICLVYTQTPKPYTFGRFLYALLAWEMCERTFETPCILVLLLDADDGDLAVTRSSIIFVPCYYSCRLCISQS